MNEDYFKANRTLWDASTAIHERSAFYDVPGFKAGKSSLKPVELEEVGDVRGKSLLHLQCHFGLDTLSWARLGARVTGVDFSPEAVRLARSLAAELNLEARFVLSNVYDLPAALGEQFDVVFTSYGVLCWLPDLARWAQTVAHFLKPGGTFYAVEFHPVALTLDDEGRPFKYPYFHSPEPLNFEGAGDYADRAADFPHASYEWFHPLGDIVTSLINAGLRIEFLHEFPFSSYATWP
ncbi:MAG TPA: class I SAM-dependent methyltransferase, partial [Pyrinomonadaceae bacterium]|nr:class I SAM-dependent methyltransferase [Pyrinomonadaceae bacterium]